MPGYGRKDKREEPQEEQDKERIKERKRKEGRFSVDYAYLVKYSRLSCVMVKCDFSLYKYSLLIYKYIYLKENTLYLARKCLIIKYFHLFLRMGKYMYMYMYMKKNKDVIYIFTLERAYEYIYSCEKNRSEVGL